MNRLITILFLGMTTIIMEAKTDKEQIETLYREIYNHNPKPLNLILIF